MPHARRDNMDAGLQACVAGSRSGRASWQTPFRRHCEERFCDEAISFLIAAKYEIASSQKRLSQSAAWDSSQ